MQFIDEQLRKTTKLTVNFHPIRLKYTERIYTSPGFPIIEETFFPQSKRKKKIRKEKKPCDRNT